ncbi:hypothetical protein ACIHCX_10595 [Streptomyces sp. NPDC052043]|uniref:hypothetical protein n=1 Tax=Streptomyces sp. NPDC052043 TaxID=3365684 RepID=UPI0037D43A13
MTTTGAQDPTRKATALIPLPNPADLTEQQVRGITCVWDGVALTPETAIDLGPRRRRHEDPASQWFPRGCRRCTGERAYVAMFTHTSLCADGCRTDAAGCEIGSALRRLAIRGHR